jgi:ABC-type arginine transport system permease subunit
MTRREKLMLDFCRWYVLELFHKPKGRKEKEKEMKFYIRRAVVGVIAVPVIAGAYWLFYALLVGAGADPTNTAQGVWENGLVLGWTVAVLFTFAPQVWKLAMWGLGEEK